jgi:hypothetical protein
MTLLALWAHASFDRGTCYPGVPTLARRARLSERQVYESLKALRDAGAVSWESQPGRLNVYTVSFGFIRELVAGDPYWTNTPAPHAGVEGDDLEPTPAPHAGDPCTAEQGPLHSGALTPAHRAGERGSNREKKPSNGTEGADTASPSGSESLNDTAHHLTTPDKGKAKAPTYAAVAERIVEASRPYGGDVEVRTRRVMGRFQREPLATLAYAELRKIEKANGLPKGTLALQALFSAVDGEAVKDQVVVVGVRNVPPKAPAVPEMAAIIIDVGVAAGGEHEGSARQIAENYRNGVSVSFVYRALVGLCYRAHIPRARFPSYGALDRAKREDEAARDAGRPKEET